jgi:predicted aldo/keto reductase-like oxidoreductase
MLDKTAENIFDTCQFPMNVVDASVEDSFIKHVLPRTLERNMGVLAMKSLADGRFFSKKIQSGRQIWDTNDPVIPEYLTIEEALNFVWSLPVSVLITGAENPQLVKEKISIAKRFEKLTKTQREKLIDKVMDMAEGEDVEYYKSI